MALHQLTTGEGAPTCGASLQLQKLRQHTLRYKPTFCVSYHDSRVDAELAKFVSFQHLDDLWTQLNSSAFSYLGEGPNWYQVVFSGKLGYTVYPKWDFLRGKMTIDFGYPFSDQPRTELIKVDKWCVNHTPHSQGPNMGYMGGRPTQIQNPSEHSTWQICPTTMWMDDINGCHVVSPIIIAHVFDCLHTLHPTHFC